MTTSQEWAEKLEGYIPEEPRIGGRFPTYQSHEAASCFNCGADLDGSYPHKTGFAAKAGAWAQDCPKCGMFTSYDLEEPQ